MQQVCLGPGGIVQHIRAGGWYIDHTTNSPAVVRQVHQMLAERGVAMLDAPVSGGMEEPQTRDLLVMAGGEPAVFERARPLTFARLAAGGRRIRTSGSARAESSIWVGVV